MRLLFTAIFFCLLSAGCSTRIPEPITYPYSQQYKMQASHHWQVLAADLANRINNQLILSGNINTSTFVQETCGDESKPCEPLVTSPFNEAFRDLLISNLVAYGVPTEKQRTDDSIEIQYKVQLVRHNADRLRTIQPGVLTAISAAIVVLRNAPSELAILATGVASDVANTSMAFSGHYEIIITTSMIENNKYLFRASDIYYINDRDFWQYSNAAPKSATISLTTKEQGRSAVHSLPMTTPPPANDEEQAAPDEPTTPKTNL